MNIKNIRVRDKMIASSILNSIIMHATMKWFLVTIHCTLFNPEYNHSWLPLSHDSYSWTWKILRRFCFIHSYRLYGNKNMQTICGFQGEKIEFETVWIDIIVWLIGWSTFSANIDSNYTIDPIEKTFLFYYISATNCGLWSYQGELINDITHFQSNCRQSKRRNYNAFIDDCAMCIMFSNNIVNSMLA